MYAVIKKVFKTKEKLLHNILVFQFKDLLKQQQQQNPDLAERNKR